MLQQVTMLLVWCNLEAHNIFSPAKEEHMQMLLDLEQATAERSAGTTARSLTVQLFVDKRLLFDNYANRLAGEGRDEDMLGTEDG